MRHDDGNWAGYTYEWNAGGTEANRVIGGKTVQVAGQTWEFPSESQCLQCHTAAAGRTLGLEVGQLNGDFGYPTGRTANQLATLDFINTLTGLTGTPAQLPVIPDPFGSASLGSRARAYLHTNCANCHQPNGGAQSNMDLRFATALQSTNACDVAPTLGDLGIANARLIAPGSAARSVVVARVNRTGANAMPPLSRHQIDAQGVQLLTDWVNGLGSCN
jgi:mono/diheme cytochrome c family protein